MPRELSEEQKEYIKQRGFKVVEGEPFGDETYPYITLRKPQKWIWESEITYHESSNVKVRTPNIITPLSMPREEIVSLIESMVAGDIDRDGDGEGRLFKTQPGEPFRIFVMDYIWMDIANFLAEKYE